MLQWLCSVSDEMMQIFSAKVWILLIWLKLVCFNDGNGCSICLVRHQLIWGEIWLCIHGYQSLVTLLWEMVCSAQTLCWSEYINYFNRTFEFLLVVVEVVVNGINIIIIYWVIIIQHKYIHALLLYNLSFFLDAFVAVVQS